MLLLPSDRRKVQTRFGGLLLTLSMTLCLRALDAIAPHPLLTWLAWTSFAVFPLVTALFLESALPAGLPLLLKGLLLLGVTTIPVASAVPSAQHSSVLVLAVAGWQLVVFLSLLAFLAWRVFVASDAVQRSRATALFLGALLAVIALGNDWAASLGAPTKRLGAACVIIVFHLVAEALFAEQRFRLRRTTLRLALLALGSLAAGGLLVLVLELPLSSLPLTVATTFFICAALLPVQSAFAHAHAQRSRTLQLRLSALPTHSMEAFVAALRNWPELRGVIILSAQQQQRAGFDELPRLFREQAGVIDRAALRFLAEGAPGELLRATEQAQHLLALHELDAFVSISDDGAVLGVGFSALLPGQAHRQALELLGLLAGLLFRVEATPKERAA